MTDAEFLRAFERGALRGPAFRHREHLRLAWLSVRRDGALRAEAAAVAGMRRLAAAHGAPGRSHDTLTRFWVRLVAPAAAAPPAPATFRDLLERYPFLLDPTRPDRHYAPGTLTRPAARAAWAEPDRRPLPA